MNLRKHIGSVDHVELHGHSHPRVRGPSPPPCKAEGVPAAVHIGLEDDCVGGLGVEALAATADDGQALPRDAEAGIQANNWVIIKA